MAENENDEQDESVFEGKETSELDEDVAKQVEGNRGPPQPSGRDQAAQQPDLEPVLENLEEITELVREYFEQSRESKRVEIEGRQQRLRHRERIIYTAAIAFLGVVLVSAGMTWVDALSGDAFTFVLGTLFGSILTFLQTTLGGSQSAE